MPNRSICCCNPLRPVCDYLWMRFGKNIDTRTKTRLRKQHPARIPSIQSYIKLKRLTILVTKCYKIMNNYSDFENILSICVQARTRMCLRKRQKKFIAWISVTYFCQRHEIYDHCVFIVWSRWNHDGTTAWRKLRSARSSFMADRRHLVTRRRRRLRNFCDASPIRRSPLSFLRSLNLSIRVASSIIVSEIRYMIFHSET